MNKFIGLSKFIAIVLVTLFFILATLPKENLYYKLEEFFSSKSIIVYDERLKTTFNSLSIKDGIINYNELDSAFFKNINISTTGIMSIINIEGLRINKDLYDLILPNNKNLPRRFTNFEMSHKLVNPFNIDIFVKFENGNLKGNIDLLEQKVNLSLFINKNLNSNEKQILRNIQFKKDSSGKKGVYVYEYKY